MTSATRDGNDSTPKGGRPATGSIVWADPETKQQPIGVRVTKAGGGRKLVRFDPGTTREDALALAPIMSARARSAVEEEAGLSLSEYAGKWLAERERRSLASAPEDRRRFKNHILPDLGALLVGDVTRVDLVGFVERLDKKVRDGAYGWKRCTSGRTCARCSATPAARRFGSWPSSPAA
jgi:hypothetical protein